MDECGQFLKTCSQERRDKFFQEWCARIYDMDSVEQEWDLRKKPQEQTVKSFFQQRFQKFYSSLLADKCLEPLRAQRETSLKAVTSREVALACERLAVGYGLPKDGHLVHSCLQGKVEGMLRVHGQCPKMGY